jgi:hypothetical protein
LNSPELLNSKLPRSAFDDLLNKIGELILAETELLLTSENEVSQFLNDNPLPKNLVQYLPDNFRVYCLALNSMKQWLSAEQAATDRFIFGGTAREQYKTLGKQCLLSGKSAAECTIELHHPVRDGRPPIPLAKDIHTDIEGQAASSSQEKDEIMDAIYPIKRAGNRSWVMLKTGCELLLGIQSASKSKNVQAASKTFARKACGVTGMNEKELLDWLAVKNLI